MSTQPKAVFLSYASQDAAAAKVLCDALRAGGLEVWFDQSELRGGDAWDASIRRQIRDCALFVPIISATTQERTEGYFRLEWRLAEQRSHLMAKGRPFLLPVVIDATSEREAHVPEAFLEVQWSRIPGGSCDAAFVERVRHLLAGGIARAAPPMRPAAPRMGAARLPSWALGLAAVAVIAVGGIVATWLAQRPPGPVAGTAPAPGSAAQLVAKARALLDDDPLMTRRNVELAEQLALQAIAKDPADGEAFAAAAWANYQFLSANYEDTPKRRADLRSYAEKAKLLAPDSVNAELAICGLLLASSNRAEALARLDKLAIRAPGNLAVLRTRAWESRWKNADAWGEGRVDEDASIQRLRAHSPVGRSYADSTVAATYWVRGRYAEADRLLDRIFASGHPDRRSYLLRLLILTYGWGDLEAARRFAEGLPSSLLLEDVFIGHLSTVWLWSGDYDQALRTLGRTPRELLHEALVVVPAALARGDVEAAAGRTGTAAIQWREALRVVDRQLEARTDDREMRELRAILLARLGERKAALAEQALFLEMSRPEPGSIPWGRQYQFHLAMGDLDGASVRLDRLLKQDNGRWPGTYNHLRYDPACKAMRADPRGKALLARGAKWMAEMKAAASRTNGPSAGSAAKP